MDTMRDIIGKMFFMPGAILSFPFLLMFNTGGSSHWKELSIPGKIIFIILGIPMLVGMPLMYLGDRLVDQDKFRAVQK